MLGEEIKKQYINGNRVILLSSTANRACQGAEILSEVLGVEYQPHEVLWSDSMYPEDCTKVLELVRRHKNRADIIILVTHLEYGEGFPSHFGQHELDGTNLDGRGIEKGQAWLIDCQTKQMELLVPVVC